MSKLSLQKLICTIILVVTICDGFGQITKDSTKREYDDYLKSTREDFKSESIWYKTFNRFDINPGFSKYAIGPAVTKPLNGWDDFDQTFALRYRVSHLEFSASWWDGTKKGEIEKSSTSRFSAGYFTPIARPIGRRELDVKGFLIQPVLGLGIGRNDAQYGAYLSPGLHVQLPFSVIGLRLNTEYTFDGSLNVIPEVSFQLDALRNLLDPHKVKTGDNTYNSTTAEPLGGGWYKVTHKSTTSGVYLNDIGPFWGITPRYGIMPSRWVDKGVGNLYSYGVGISGRINFLGADISISKGQVIPGVNGQVEALHSTVASKFDSDQVAGVMNTTEINFEGTVNIVGLVFGIIKPNNYRDMGMTTTPLNRFNFHLGMTRFIPGNVTYNNAESAKTYTDNFFASYPEIERNAINDPTLHESNWGVSYGMSYELGVVGVGVYNKITKTMGQSTLLEVYYIIPITKVLKAYKD